MMKRIALVLVALLVVGGVVVGFGDAIEHLIEGGDHKEANHAETAASGHRDEHDHGAEAKETSHGAEEKGHAGEEGSEIRLTPGQIELAGIQSIEAKLGRIDLAIDLAGEVQVNQDKVVQVVPRVSGVVRSVKSVLGDRLEPESVMAILDSRELADAKSAYVAAQERRKLVESTYQREEGLWKKRISSEQEYLSAKSALAEARIVERAALQQLRALGTSEEDLKQLSNGSAASFTRYEIRAPIAGTIIEKHISNGASVDQREPIFKVADLETVWVIASVYEKDIARIKMNQRAAIVTKAHADKTFEGRISWIADTLDERTRTLKVRIEVDNAQRLLKPGMFVNASVFVDARENVLSIPVAAVQRQGGETIVFVDEGNGKFERHEIETGVRSNGLVEVIKGLKPRQRIVAAGSFILKSELEKEGFGGGHAH